MSKRSGLPPSLGWIDYALGSSMAVISVPRWRSILVVSKRSMIFRVRASVVVSIGPTPRQRAGSSSSSDWSRRWHRGSALDSGRPQRKGPLNCAIPHLVDCCQIDDRPNKAVVLGKATLLTSANRLFTNFLSIQHCAWKEFSAIRRVTTARHRVIPA